MVVIVTVYRSANYGSYLQAKMLREILLRYVDKVYFLDEGQRNFFEFSDVRDCISSIVRRRDIKRVHKIISKILFLRKSWKSLPSIHLKDIKDNNNIIVLGSDEIWNVTRENCSSPFFWGDGLKGKIFSYAPSVNMADYNRLLKFGAQSYLEKMQRISVRDNHSYTVLSGLTSKPLKIVLDPTLLFDSDYYLKDSNYKPLKYKYIAVYFFAGNKEIGVENNILKFARKYGLKLVSVGTPVNWCDINIVSSDVNSVPFLYYLDAEYVVTNTFHGTAFAINFAKNFVSFARNNKIKDLLESFDLLDRDVLGKDYCHFEQTLLSQIDIDSLLPLKKSKQKESLDFIADFFS